MTEMSKTGPLLLVLVVVVVIIIIVLIKNLSYTIYDKNSMNPLYVFSPNLCLTTGILTTIACPVFLRDPVIFFFFKF